MAAMAFQSYGNGMAGTMHMTAQETPKKKRPQNCESALLSYTENQSLFNTLGQNSICLSAGVAELLRASGGKWTRALRGVISLVKDYERRSYFLKMIDIVTHQCLWEFKLYKGFQAIYYPRHLITFEGENDSHVYGLNFSSHSEAETFKEHLDKRFEQEKRNGGGYSSTISEKQSIAPPPRPQPPPSSISSTPTLPRAVPGQSPFNASGVTVAYPSMNRNDNTIKSSTNIFGMKKNNKDTKKKRIRKEDISNPTNFQHKAHVGWDQDTGFSNNADPNPLDDTIRTILKAAGEDPSQMSKKTIKFVYDFIEKYQEDGQPINNGSSFPQSQRDWPIPRSAQSSSPSIPLPPSRGSSSSSTILPPPSRPPPPPPSSINRIRPLPILPNGRPIDGPPLPPSSIHSSSVPPPPPPPPPSLPPISSGPPPPPPPPPLGGAPPPPPSIPSSSSTTTSSSNPSSGNLLAEIQAGKQLKSVGDQMEKKSLGTPDSRDDVMAQIRLGTTLRHIDVVEKEKRKSSGVDNVGGIAGALARALEERRQNMGMDDNDSDDDNNDSENDWSD